MFDPSGTRFYVTSQRARRVGGGDAPGAGEVYEITGPFRLAAPDAPARCRPRDPREPGRPSARARAARRGVGPALGVEVPRRIS